MARYRQTPRPRGRSKTNLRNSRNRDRSRRLQRSSSMPFSLSQSCILLYGPAGCGKTHFLLSTAHEFRLRREFINCKKLKESFVEGVKTQLFFKKLFARARESAPSMIILDDIDEITSKTTLKHPKIRKAVYQLLRELELVKGGDRILVSATTNRPYFIEPLLFKEKRFDKLVFVPMPNQEVRQGLFEQFLKAVPTDIDINTRILGRISRGYNGSDIRKIVNYADHLAEDDRTKISMEHLETALKDIRPSLTPSILDPIKKFFLGYKSGTLCGEPEPEPITSTSSKGSGSIAWDEEDEEDDDEDVEQEIAWSDAVEEDEVEDDAEDDVEVEEVEIGWDDAVEEDEDDDDDDDEDDNNDDDEGSQYRRKWMNDDLSL